MFLSGLSVSEFVLLPGIRVLGIVYGSVVHGEGEIELTEYTRVMKPSARSQSRIIATALSRLQENAAKIGATGIIGVKIQHRSLEKNISEYTILGTAVAEDVLKPQAKPFICTLSGKDYWTLVANGYRPVGIAFGVSVYSQRFRETVQRKVKQGLNTERSDFSIGLYRARKYAFDALHQEAKKLNAEGVLALTVSIDKKMHRQFSTSEGMVIKMVAMGTAVVSCPKSDLPVSYSMPLAD